MIGKSGPLSPADPPTPPKPNKAPPKPPPQTVASDEAPRRTAERVIRVVSPRPSRAFPSRITHPSPTRLSSPARKEPQGPPKGIPAHGQNALQILVSSLASDLRRPQPLSIPAPRPTHALSSELQTGGWCEEVLSYHLRTRVKIRTLTEG